MKANLPTSKTGTLAANNRQGFTLIELLVVLGILSMMAGVILPSAVAFIRRDRLDQFVFDVSLLCRETFEQSVYEGRRYRIQRNEKNELVPLKEENATFTPVMSVLLRPVTQPAGCGLEWPENGWQTMPEGFCETPLLRFSDNETGETRIMRVRAYDANLIRESEQFAAPQAGNHAH